MSEPTIQIPEKLQRVLESKKRFNVIIGGRGSAKSESTARILLLRAQTEQADVLCGREYQNSIDDSVHKLLRELVYGLGLPGVNVRDTKIDLAGGGGFRYKGFARDSNAVKSAQGFKYSWVEEAHALSEQSIRDLTPTIRAEGSQLFFTANPQSSADPFSKRFIAPFIDKVIEHGYYEDDLHLVVLVNWRDNPWFPQELEAERRWDFDNLPRATYDHIWEGAFNDSVDDALILSEWFDACIDAHKALGFQAVGARVAAHDPSDTGADAKGYAFRHGSVVKGLALRDDLDINDGGDWATGKAIEDNADQYNWDCDGLGVGLKRDTAKAFEGKHTKIGMFKGSEAPDHPDREYEPVEGLATADRKTNKDVFANKRAQYYVATRDRIKATYDAVVKGRYTDPDKMLSFDTDSPSVKELLPKLRSELCRLPKKPNPNGRIQLYSKPDMLTKFKIKSPNLGDALMMTMRVEEDQPVCGTVLLPTNIGGSGWMR